MTIEPKWTHKGWLLFCPIKLANPDSWAPDVAARWAAVEYLLDFAELVQGCIIFLCSAFIPDYEPHFFFTVTGEL